MARLRLILVPALLSLAVTLLRLAGERGHWSARWFSSETSGIRPTGVSWVVGITWLAIPFGAYFGWRLASSGKGHSSALRSFFLWPELALTLLAYGLAARIPVVIVMFLAMRGNWGTHYDYVGMPGPLDMAPWSRFVWLALLPQLVFWVAFTIVVGSISGTLAALFVRRRA